MSNTYIKSNNPNTRMNIRNFFLPASVKQIKIAMENQIYLEAHLALKELLEECEAHGVSSPSYLPLKELTNDR
jgi:diketogulonate reductase-like aldo/keto reductase